MDKLVVRGGRPLVGRVTVSGAKNATLPLMCAPLAGPGPEQAEQRARPARRAHHGPAHHHPGRGGGVQQLQLLTLDTTDAKGVEAPYDLVKTMRASVLAMGPLVARRGRARVSLCPAAAPSASGP